MSWLRVVICCLLVAALPLRAGAAFAMAQETPPARNGSSQMAPDSQQQHPAMDAEPMTPGDSADKANGSCANAHDCAGACYALPQPTDQPTFAALPHGTSPEPRIAIALRTCPVPDKPPRA
jgi:hypothetical protein